MSDQLELTLHAYNMHYEIRLAFIRVNIKTPVLKEAWISPPPRKKTCCVMFNNIYISVTSVCKIAGAFAIKQEIVS